MIIVSRANLASFLTGNFCDPDQEFQEEFNAFASVILADSPNYVQWFIYSDHENGNDPQVSSNSSETRVLVDQTFGKVSHSYYGVNAHNSWEDLAPVVFYDCYLGGSEGASASGFVITCARIA
jgi:hypothetical protein